VENVARFIGKHLQSFKVIVNKSTVPVGTQKKVKAWIREELNKRNISIDFEVVSNPEFLREGIAVEDCLKPARVIIGAEHEEAIKIVRRLYEPFVKNGNPIWVMSPESAELSKYAANTMLAAKISMMNELSRLAYQTGADIEDVRKAVGSDPRIGPHFLFAGVGYGGSCFPKDVRALVNMGEQHQSEMFLMKAIDETNRSQRVHFAQRIKARVGGLQGKVWAHWGSSFKPGTDDIREAPALDLIHQALSEGSTVHLFDPASAMKIQSHFQEHPRLKIFKEQYEALQGADFLVLTTEWKSFREPNFEKMKNNLKQPLLFDGRNIWNPSLMKELGFEYHSIGRPNI
jgi:UDPglucose 6-dehydrogenase